jgi:Pentapeptide repeats (8 copies)
LNAHNTLLSTLVGFARLPNTAKSRVVGTWLSAKPHIARSYQWLADHQQAVFLLAGIVIVIGLFFVNVIAAAAVTAAWVALIRHYAQTEADRQRRIAESFSKAAEQLAHDKIEVRLGGIYTLERISRESLYDYWTVMETLTAFIRERARWADRFLPGISDSGGGQSDLILPHEIPTDIAAVLSVIVRRSEEGRRREKSEDLHLNLRDADLRGADLVGAHLEGAFLNGAYLQGADLSRAFLTGAKFNTRHNAVFQGTKFYFVSSTNLSGASLIDANLDGADLTGAFLKQTRLKGAHLKGTVLIGTNLSETLDLTEAQLCAAIGTAMTVLPKGLTRPANWPA